MSYSEAGPDDEDDDVNLATLIEGHPPDRTALVVDDARITYGELERDLAFARVAFARLGVGPDTVVAVATGNEPGFVVAAFAVLGLGGVVMPLNPSSTAQEFERKVVSGRVDVVLAGGLGRGLLDHAGVVEAAVHDLDAVLADAASGGIGIDDAPPIVDRERDADAFHMATSGVSGVPKIAVLSHGNLWWVQETLAGLDEPVEPDDVFLGSLPFSHIYGLSAVMMTALRVGATLVLQPRFDVDGSLELVRRHGVTVLSGAPPMWQRWATADVPDDSLASVRFATSGAAALPVGVFEAVRDRYGIEIGQGYGLTETSSMATMSRGIAIRPSSVGKVIPGAQIALVDPDGNPVDVGDEGEVVIRHPGVFTGYLDDPDATHSVLTDDGWLWTGDVGIFDDDGYLYLVDRLKDVIIVSGFNVYPAEVEDVLMQHPDVTGAIVVGTADEYTGETVVAHVAGTASEEALREHVAEYLSRYKRPTRYHLVDQLPISPNGKIIRRALR